MKYRTPTIQIVCLLSAIALLGVATWVHRPMAQRGEDATRLAQEDLNVLRQNPELSVITTLPGGLRVLAVNYLWMRSQEAHNEGRHFDAYQLADAICRLQPYYPGVWAFQAWNMAWNISVTAVTPEERWQWVYNGVELLRDRGIALNPKSLILYKELAWIFVSKIGGRMDDMHLSYKQRWAGEMQRLLGAPPYSDNTAQTLAEATQAAIDAFRPIAEAPLNRDRAKQGRQRIQTDAREQLLADSGVAAYAQRLAALNVNIDESLLDAYNAWSLDPAVDVVRVLPPRPQAPAEQQLSEVINDPQARDAREAMLAFVRAQLLWNRYKMDPQFMLELMERQVTHDGENYPIPLDWRHSMSHGLYWAAYGMKVCDLGREASVDRTNNMRNVLTSLKTLTNTGQLVLQQNPSRPLYPTYHESTDLRYVEATHQQHLAYVEQLNRLREAEGLPPDDFEDNLLAGGHVNYLIGAMKMLVADGRLATAQRYFDFCKDDYARAGREDWEFNRVEDFIYNDYIRQPDLRYDTVMPVMEMAIKRALLARGGYGHDDLGQGRFRFARRLYDLYQSKAVTRMKLVPFEQIVARLLANLLARPQAMGVVLDLQQRSQLFSVMASQPRIQQMAYHATRSILRRLCEAEGIDFEKAFPTPAGYERYLQDLQQMPQTRDQADPTAGQGGL